MLQFRNLEEFFLHNIIRLLALSMFDIFSSIYVFIILSGSGLNYSASLGLTAIFLALSYFAQLISLKPTLSIMSRVGLRLPMFWGNILLICFSALLYFSKFNLFLLIPSAFIRGIHMSLYYTGYHIYFAQLTDDKRQGKELAVGNALFALVGILGPSAGGLVISFWGFGELFLGMVLILLLSSIPLHFISNKAQLKIVPIKFSTLLSFKNEGRNILAIGGLSIVDATAAYFWPLFIFIILAGNFISVGILGSIITGAGIFSAILLGWFIDKLGPKKIITSLSVGDSMIWIIKAFSQTPFMVFFSSILQALTTHNLSLTLDAMIYEKARDRGSVTPVIQRELSFAIFKTSFLLLSGLMLWFGLPIMAIFFLASAAALLTRAYSTHTHLPMPGMG